MKKGKLLIVTGPSGVGKDTIVTMFKQKHPDWQRPASVTTRSPRPGETEGVDYFFVGRPTFDKKVKEGEFLEWVQTTGNLYGTPKAPIEKILKDGKNIITVKDVRGALTIRKLFPETIAVCLLPEKREVLEQRFRGRATDSEELTQARLRLAEKELDYKKYFDHLIINYQNRPEDALTEVEKIAGL